MVQGRTRRAPRYSLVALLLLCGIAQRLRAEGIFTLSFECPERIIAPPGSQRTETCFTMLSHEGEGTGPQGWSYGVESLSCAVTSATTDGTAVEGNGFVKVQTIDPAKNGGRTGFVCGTALSVAGGFELPGGTTHRIAKLAVEFAVAAEEVTAVLRFEEGLRGAGQPVVLSVWQGGDTVEPAWVDHAIRVAPPSFLRGDANPDGKLDIGDPLWILEVLFRAWGPAACEDAADANDDGRLDISDAVHILGYLFLGDDPPGAPYPECGPDPTVDGLRCEEESPCAR